MPTVTTTSFNGVHLTNGEAKAIDKPPLKTETNPLTNQILPVTPNGETSPSPSPSIPIVDSLPPTPPYTSSSPRRIRPGPSFVPTGALAVLMGSPQAVGSFGVVPFTGDVVPLALDASGDDEDGPLAASSDMRKCKACGKTVKDCLGWSPEQDNSTTDLTDDDREELMSDLAMTPLIPEDPSCPIPPIADGTSLFGSSFIQLPLSDQIRELQTVLRDKMTSRSDFIFYADRLIRLVVEEGLNLLPTVEKEVVTPTGATYQGLAYCKGNCGVSVIRSGEAMEKGLRDCCRSIRIGKILIQSDPETCAAHVVYAKFPEDVAERKVLLMYPILSSGNTVSAAIRVLVQHRVIEENIVLLTLFATPKGLRKVIASFPGVRVLSSEIHPVAPNHFGQRYFGTD